MKKQKQIKINLTDEFLRTRKLISIDGPRIETYWDKKSNLKALQYKSGGIVFWSHHWFNNQTIYYNQGKWNENTDKVADARRSSRDTQTNFIDKGLDPSLEKKRLKFENYRKQITEAKRMMFKQLIEKYIEILTYSFIVSVHHSET